MHRNDIVKSKIADPELVEWRRAQIINAAVDLFGRQGYHATKMRDIADKAGVSIGLIYQYVQDKEDVLFLTILEVLNSYLREVPAAVSDETEPLMRFRRAIHAYCMVNHVNADATVLAYRETKSLAPERRDLIKEKELETNKMIEVFVRDCEDAGLFEPVDTELFVYQIVMFSHTWALKAWRFRKLMTVNEYVERGLGLMLNATLTPHGMDAYRALARNPLPAEEELALAHGGAFAGAPTPQAKSRGGRRRTKDAPLEQLG